MRSMIFQPGLLMSAALMCSGCGLTGQWASTSLEPEIARDEFRLFDSMRDGREFTKATVDLHDDGTYSAEVYYGEKIEQSTGTWESAGRKLTFVDSRGRSQTYEYTLSGDHKKLTIVREIEGTDVVLELKRQS